MPLPALAGVALRHRLAGLEFGVAIPATPRRRRADERGRPRHMRWPRSVESVEVFRLRAGVLETVPGAPASGSATGGRRSPSDSVVVGARLDPAAGDPVAIRAAMDEAREWRRATQPLAEPNCGSVFTNPQGQHAARLIEAAGAKGRRVGGARVSTKHANFIVAEPGALAADVVALIAEVRSMVEADAGVALETEVRLVGSFP